MPSLTLDEFLDRFQNYALEHEYDPIKAREYYLRTRELKGRRKGSVEPTSSRPSAKPPVSSPSNSAAKLKALKAKRARAAAIREKARVRVAELKRRLAKLERILAELTRQAKARSGVKTDADGKTKTSSTTDSKDRKPLTAKQKREAAEKAKERREKEGDKSTTVETKELEAKIEKVRERIEKMKAQIADARKNAQAKKKPVAKTSSKTASNRR